MNAHTDRARAAAKRDYLGFIHRAGAEDLASWVNDMQARGLAANTIRQRYYLLRPWLGIKETVHVPAPNTLHERKWLDATQIRALLFVIPLHETGRRDFALLATLLVSGQRVGQVRLWRWRDAQQKTVPRVVFEAIQAIPERAKDSQAGNMSPSLGNAFVFSTPRRCMGLNREREVISVETVQQPVSPQEINRRIQRYARLAGLEPGWHLRRESTLHLSPAWRICCHSIGTGCAPITHSPASALEEVRPRHSSARYWAQEAISV